MHAILKRFGLLLGTFGLVVLAFLAFVRPWYLSWGATEAEQEMSLPGDSIVVGAGTQNTRAITIHAPADQIWPWLAQIGQDRGGFYSYDRLENLVGCEMPNPGVLLPDKQQWKLGDKLWMYPDDKARGEGFARLRVLEPGRALGFGTKMFGTTREDPETGSWSFALVPIDSGTTRLLIRGRGTVRSLLGTAFDRTVFEPVHFAMERRMMVGLAGIAEGNPPSKLADDIQISLWMISFVLVGVAKLLVVFRERWQRPLVGFAASLVVFQILTLAQPHVLVGSLLIAGLGALLLWPSFPHIVRPHVEGAHRLRTLPRSEPGGGALDKGTWYRAWDTVADELRVARHHLSAATQILAEYDEACGQRSHAEVSVSPLETSAQRRAAGR